LMKHDGGTASAGDTVTSTGSIFSSVPVKETTPLVVVWGGSYNGFYNSFGGATFGTSPVAGGATPPFQSSMAGSYYLSSGTPFLNAAPATSIPAALLTDLKKRTVSPPLTIYSSQTLSSSQTFGPAVPRENATGNISLGYHYPPLDYIFNNVTVSAAITLQDGVAVGISGGNANVGAINGLSGANIVSVGRPERMNEIVSCQNVQEQPLSASQAGFLSMNGNSANASYQFRFTEFSIGQGTVINFVANNFIGNLDSFMLQDCRVRSAQIGAYILPYYGNIVIGFTNNLFERCQISLAYQYSNYNGPNNALFHCFNNLFWNGTFYLTD